VSAAAIRWGRKEDEEGEDFLEGEEREEEENSFSYAAAADAAADRRKSSSRTDDVKGALRAPRSGR
jgi:hypothetical protein